MTLTLLPTPVTRSRRSNFAQQTAAQAAAYRCESFTWVRCGLLSLNSTSAERVAARRVLMARQWRVELQGSGRRIVSDKGDVLFQDQLWAFCIALKRAGETTLANRYSDLLVALQNAQVA
jgi:hypothetical protein